MRLLVKLGGTLLESRESRRSLARQLCRLSEGGHDVVVVHGGGKRLSRYLSGLDHQSEFRNGLRVTPPEIMDAVLRVLGGSVNRQLVAELQGVGARAVGLTGIDSGTVQAAQLSPELGLVGRVEKVNPALLNMLLAGGYLPAVACIAGGARGEIYNVNADQMAAACARGLLVDRLLFLTDVGGVLGKDGRRIPRLAVREAELLIESGVATGGMEAKLRAAIEALGGGIGSVSIVNGHETEILAKTLAVGGLGTTLVP